MSDFDEARAAGLRVRHDMFGPQGAEEAVRGASDFAAPFHDFLSRYCFGEFWTREDLNRRDRSLVTLAMLIALGRENEVRMHVKGGLKNGLTVAEIRELVLHAIAYCGIPLAFGAVRAAEEALRDVGAVE